MPQIINLVIFLFLFFLATQVLKFSLYIFYLWQVVEYRLDRFWVRITNRGDRAEALSYLNIFNLYPSNKYPKVTLRTLLTFFLFIFITYQLLFSFYRPLAKLVNIPEKLTVTAFLVAIIVYYLTPILASFLTVLVTAITWPIKKLIIYLARRKIENFKNLLVVGITGSYGKSSTKEIVWEVLRTTFNVLKTPANTNTIIGVAKTILTSLKNDHQIFVVEMGAYKKGEIKEICDLVNPEIGILTGINEQHLVLFGSLTNIQKTKYELIGSLPRNGLALFNGKNKFCRILNKKTKNCLKQLYGKESDEFSEAIDAGYMIGKFLNVPEIKIKKILPKLKKKLEIKKEKNRSGLLIFDDSYSTNPEGFNKALNIISKYQKKEISRYTRYN